MKLAGEIKARRENIEPKRGPIDSRVPTRSPATLAGLTVGLAVPDRSILLRHAAFRRAVLE